MASIIPSSFIRWMTGKIDSHSHTSIVRNKISGHMHTRDNSNMGKRPPTPAQIASRELLSRNSKIASAWMKANNADGCPPNGTPEWQRMMHQFHRQNKIGYPLQYVMSRIRGGIVVV